MTDRQNENVYHVSQTLSSICALQKFVTLLIFTHLTFRLIQTNNKINVPVVSNSMYKYRNSM